ncbi:LysR family transcriptional regulator [Alkalimarinus alittae]|uniref:LysR family transcriptional regulator n=1 Tax=Alkalimarinus alittae TaxID=2961619 RepID=A0ABY6N078_9ALTE|nr:LysR family transcriptional regulator [Alkalimarinus alittae]UZE95493.1 LysR family transcriptional regulator [Alkalimarinus alittae]
MRTPRISLEQWAAFKAVVDEGSFAKAAETLNKSQSSVSYTLSKMEELLPTPVLEQQGRKAVLTEAGEVLYRKATNLLKEAGNVESSADLLAKGWEPQVTVAADLLVDFDPLIRALAAFSNESPATRIVVLETTLSGTDEALLERRADIVLSPKVPPGFLGKPLGLVEMLPVAHPNHPLFSLKTDVTEPELRQHRQVVFRDTGIKRQQDAGWLGSEQRWTVSTGATAIKIVKRGLGFAFIPPHMIKEELDAGELKRIPLDMDARKLLPFHIILSGMENAGPACKALAMHITTQFLKESSK